MIYLEHDDGHFESSIQSYESEEDVVRHLISERPSMENPLYGVQYVDDRYGHETAEEQLKQDQDRWDEWRREIAWLFDEKSENYHGSILFHDEYSWVDASMMEDRARQALAVAEKMRRGEIMGRRG